MKNSTYFFTHDFNSRSDEKIKKLLSKHGYLGYGLFWALVEDLYNNANALRLDYACIAFDLRTDVDTITSLINDFGLFEISGDTFSSKSVKRRMLERKEKSMKASASAKERWDKEKTGVNAMRSHSDRNAIKEKKGKEKKDIISEFESFRKLFPGTKGGYQTMLSVFQKHKDWETELDKLMPGLQREIAHMESLKASNEFCPAWKHLKTWLSDRCWEQEYGKAKAPVAKKPIELGI